MTYVKAGLARCTSSLIALVALLVGLKFVQELAPPWPGSDGAAFVMSVAELFRALQWPLVAIIVAMVFKKEVAALLGKVKSGKFPLIGEIEFQEDLSDLRVDASASVRAVEQAAQIESPSESHPTDEPAAGDEKPNILQGSSSELSNDGRKSIHDAMLESLIDIAVSSQEGNRNISQWLRAFREPELARSNDVLRIAAVSPRAAMMILSTEMEQVLRSAANSRDLGNSAGKRLGSQPPSAIARGLASHGLIDPATSEGVAKFWKIRNAVVHQGLGDNDEVLRAIDSGLDLMRTLDERFPDKSE